jgi:purine-binding chemotaxis protein CheW
VKRSEPANPNGSDRGSDARAAETILGFADRLRSARKAEPEQARTFESWVVFRVSARALALPVSHVREILRLEELTGVPNAPKPIAGVMNLRGHVLPVLDTHALLGMSSTLATNSSRVLIFLLDSRPVGLIVDDVTGLERLQTELIQAMADSEPLAELARGTLPRGDNEPLLLLEPARLFAGKNPAFD